MTNKIEQPERLLEITKSSGNVFADLKLENAEKCQTKADLALQINTILQHRGLKQKEAAKMLNIDQSKVSALNCGQLDGFSIEQLIGFSNHLDRDNVEQALQNLINRPTNQQEYDVLQRLLDSLIDKVGSNEYHPLADLMAVIGDHLEAYDDKHNPPIGE